MRVVELNAEQAAAVVEDWGYPRRVELNEIHNGKWFSYGDHVIWWLTRDLEHRDRELALHICSDPEWRGRVYGRKLPYAIEVVGELYHAERLVTWLAPGDPVGGYLARWGWRLLPERAVDGYDAWARSLGGDGHGWIGTETPEAGTRAGHGRGPGGGAGEATLEADARSRIYRSDPAGSGRAGGREHR